jgi:hypothetical protein
MMTYKRKTKDVWAIQFKYQDQPWEDISEAGTVADKNYQLQEYRLSGGGQYRAVKCRVPIN